MIENTKPGKMILGDPATGYTKAYIPHSTYLDEDIVGKAFWVGDRLIVSDKLAVLYTILTGLTPGSSQSITGSYYDAMLNDALLQEKLQINMSDSKILAMKALPTITNITSTGLPVDVGVGVPVVNIVISGDADYVTIEKKKSSDGDDAWAPAYKGPVSSPITFTSEAGTFDFRLRGYIALPDGVTTEESPYSIFRNVVVEYNFEPPEAPTNLSFKVAKIMDGVERYDVQVEWDWSKGSGSNVREFVLYYVETSEYNRSQWSKANIINGGFAKSVVITGFPFNKEYKFKAASVAWGPDDQSVSSSAPVNFKIDSNTPLDSSFTNETGIEVTYSHIKAFRRSGGQRQQSFLIDAATGSVSIGLLDSQGRAPISFDPTQGAVNVDGSVISESMYTASLVLSNLSGQDNPAIRTSTKLNYGSANQGMWMGFDNSDSKFKFDLGDSTKFIRWDGDKLIISGKVQIGTPGGNVDIDKGIQGNFVGNIYRAAATRPSRPTGTAYPPTGWSTSPITGATDTVWISTAVIDSKTNLVDSNSSWSTPIQFSAPPGTDGIASVNIYRLGSTRPSTPTLKTIPPTGWSLYAPERTSSQFVWMSTAVRSGNSTSITGNWSTPTKVSGENGAAGTNGTNGADGRSYFTWIRYADSSSGSGMSISPLNKEYIGIAYNKTSAVPSTRPSDYTWSKFRGDQGVPGVKGADGSTTYTWIKYANDANGTGMSDNPSNKVYIGLAVNKTTPNESANPRDYTWSRIKGGKGDAGQNGSDGSRGPGFYAQSRPSFTGFSASAATTFFNNVFGGPPVKYDVLTQYLATNPATSDTKQWSGTAWVDPALAVHGDMVVDGTLTASKLVADEAFLQKMGVNVIYDNAAAGTQNPDSNYKMKIDLSRGSIHIR